MFTGQSANSLFNLSMFPAVQFLNLLIITTPIILVWDGPITHGLVIAAAAGSVAIVALRIQPGEAEYLLALILPFTIVAAVPSLWMFVQVLPIKIGGLSNPIWNSAAAALNRPLSGIISIDPGATLVSLARYLSAVAIAFVAAAVAIDRHRAEKILLMLIAATTIIALMVVVDHFGNFTFLSNSPNGSARVAAIESAGLGVILTLATALHMFERSKWPRTGLSAVWLKRIIVACLVAGSICSLAIFVTSTTEINFVIVCGVTIVAVAIIIRHFALGPWGVSAIVSVASVLLLVVITLNPNGQTTSLMLAFANAPKPLITVTHRILTETSWTGTGAGTFTAVVPIYKDIDEIAVTPIAPTAAAAISVEMGQPFLWAILIAATALVVLLLRGALGRGRDSLYPMTGAGCVTIAIMLAFCNAALFSTPVLILMAATIGTAIAQSKSRPI